MSELISKEKLQKWAGYLLNHSLGGIKKNEIVMIKGENICWPLMSVIQEEIIKAGGVPDVNITAPDNDRGKVFGAAMAKYGSIEQINNVPDWMTDRYKKMDKYIEILGVEYPDSFKGVKEDLAQEIMKVDAPLKDIRLAKNWVLTLFPTQAFADMEDMSLEEYTDVVVEASMVDPAELDEIEEDVAEVMEQAKSVEAVTIHPETKEELTLTMNIEGRKVVKCTGTRNFPDGEVYVSPDARSVEGEIFVDLPVFQGGTTIQGIYLKFEFGRIVEYSAIEGEEALKKIIETDEGSHRLGEFALGMNNGIKKVLKHPLFVEKVGGTMHIAIGQSYPTSYVADPESKEGKEAIKNYTDAGEYNVSAQHVDIVTDFREGGAGKAVYLDGVKLEIKNNLWFVPR